MPDKTHSGCSCGGQTAAPPSAIRGADLATLLYAAKPAEHACTCGGDTGEHVCDCGGSTGGSSTRPVFRIVRRTHALSGAIFALFLAAHFAINSSAWNPVLFGGLVRTIHAVIDAVPGITLILVFLPLTVQIASGLYLLYRDGLKYQTGGCNRGSTPRYFLQRMTALIVLGFVGLHLGTLHGWSFHDVPRTAPGPLAGYEATRLFPQLGVFGALAFLIGAWAMEFHLANGAITGAHVWNIINGDTARTRWRLVCMTLGALLALAATLAWASFGCAGLFAR